MLGIGESPRTPVVLLSCTYKQAEKYRSGKFSKEEYDNWRYNSPQSDILKFKRKTRKITKGITDNKSL